MLEWAAKDKSRSVLTLCLVLKLSYRGSDKSTTVCVLAWEISSFVGFGYEEFGIFIFSKCVNVSLQPWITRWLLSRLYAVRAPPCICAVPSVFDIINTQNMENYLQLVPEMQTNISVYCCYLWLTTDSLCFTAINLQKILFLHCKRRRDNLLRQMLLSPRYPYGVWNQKILMLCYVHIAEWATSYTARMVWL